MKYLMLILLLASCSQKSAVSVITFSPDLTYCDMRSFQPMIVGIIRTPQTLGAAYNSLELSREHIMNARRDCDEKRRQLVNIILEYNK